MNYIKNIFNDSKELTHKYIILSIIHIMFLLVASIKIKMYTWDTLIAILLPMIYFIYIRTKSGKRGFNTLNKVVSILMIIGGCYNLYLFMFRVLPYVSMDVYSIYVIISYMLTIGSSLYFILVFFIPEYKKVNIFKIGFNEKIYMGLFILYMVYFGLYLYQIIGYDYVMENVILFMLNMVVSVLESVLQVRYICLYQKFKEGRS